MLALSEPVFVCAKCGRGFLTAQPASLDQYPIWKVISGPEGQVCGGRVELRERGHLCGARRA